MSLTRNLLVASAVCTALLAAGTADARKARKAAVCAPAASAAPAAPLAAPGAAPGPAEAALLAHFDAMDANHDGLLSRAEVTAFFDNLRQQAEARLRAADVNGDGQISREEAQTALPMIAAIFDFLDADNNGQITIAEFGRLVTPQGREAIRLAIIAHVRAADTNHDGMLDLAEVQTGLPGLASRFSQLDTNGDGLLSPDELRSAF